MHDNSMISGKSVLIIDDSEAVAGAIHNILSEKGLAVQTAHTAQAAIQNIRRQKPDLIILDIGLPDVNGYEFCRLLKKEPATRYIPVLMCTSLGTVEDKASGL